MSSKLLQLPVIALISLLAFPVHATPITFQLYGTGNSNPDISAQFQMTVTEYSGNRALFHLSNIGGVASTITDVLFYDGALLGLSALRDKDDQIGGQYGLSTVDFTKGRPLHPDSLPQYPAAAFGADRDSGPGGVSNGIDPSEWLDFLFELKPTQSFSDLIAGLTGGQVYIGLHVQRIGTAGGSDWYKSSPTSSTTVQVPDGGETLILCGLGFLAVGLLQRRLANVS